MPYLGAIPHPLEADRGVHSVATLRLLVPHRTHQFLATHRPLGTGRVDLVATHHHLVRDRTLLLVATNLPSVQFRTVLLVVTHRPLEVGRTQLVTRHPSAYLTMQLLIQEITKNPANILLRESASMERTVNILTMHLEL